MKSNPLVSWFVVWAVALTCVRAKGGESAVVKDSHVNVRGQASLSGEVITQLQKGEKVLILEEIPVAKPKKGQPSKWARIQMPANRPVWVFAPYLDANNKSVTVPKVNLRAGPGENFSVVGRLERGDTVKEIRRIEDWAEIETPEKAYAFIALDLLSKTAPAAPPTVAKTDNTAAQHPKSEPERTLPSQPAAKPESAPSPLNEQPLAETTPATIKKPSSAPTSPPATNPATTESTPAVGNVVATEAATAPTAPPQNTTAALPPVATPPAAAERLPADAGPPPKRIVRREGVPRSAKSFQAPSNLELVSPDTRKVMNYLHTLNPELKLKEFKGKKIIVTGEEGIDPRWPNTPLLEVETIELAP